MRNNAKILYKAKKEFTQPRQLKKYLAYAAGEILLVMIGILLAIQVSNWNQEKSQRKEEQIALTNLKKDR